MANFCELERGDTEEQKLVMGMKVIADLNLKIVNGHIKNGHINKHTKPCQPSHFVSYTSTRQLKEHEALARKTAAVFSNALSMAEYVYNQPEISDESRVGPNSKQWYDGTTAYTAP